MKITNITFFIAFLILLLASSLIDSMISFTFVKPQIKYVCFYNHDSDLSVETLENSSESNIDISRMNYSFERVKEDSSIQLKLILYVRDYHDLVVTEFDSIVEILDRLFIYEDDLLFIGVKKEESYTRNYVSSSGTKVSISRFSRGCLPNFHNVTINVKKEE